MTPTASPGSPPRGRHRHLPSNVYAITRPIHWVILAVLCLDIGTRCYFQGVSLQQYQAEQLDSQSDAAGISTLQRRQILEEDDQADEASQEEATSGVVEAESQESEQEELRDLQPLLQLGYIRPNVTYGHIHMAKTAGTTLNGEIAMRYERVCGHKGYSYDAIQQNRRVKQLRQEQSTSNRSQALLKHTLDIYSELKKGGYNRGRVPPSIMWEIGWEDCDWISIEQPYNKWIEIQKAVRQAVELHIPCRDPVDHLLSQCNYHKIEFQCDITPDEPQPLRISGGRRKGGPVQLKTPLDQIQYCIKDHPRFPVVGTASRFTRKCYDYHATEQYIDYMKDKLQTKRIVEAYGSRSSNAERKKERECLTTTASPELRQQVRDYLMAHYRHYKFCDRCMGSSEELFTYEPKPKPERHQPAAAAAARDQTRGRGPG